MMWQWKLYHIIYYILNKNNIIYKYMKLNWAASYPCTPSLEGSIGYKNTQSLGKFQLWFIHSVNLFCLFETLPPSLEFLITLLRSVWIFSGNHALLQVHMNVHGGFKFITLRYFHFRYLVVLAIFNSLSLWKSVNSTCHMISLNPGLTCNLRWLI